MKFQKTECRQFTFWMFCLIVIFYSYQAYVNSKIAFLAFAIFAVFFAYCVVYPDTFNITIRGNIVEKEIDMYIFGAIFLWIGYQYLSGEGVLSESLSDLLMNPELSIWIYLVVGIAILSNWISKNALINIHIRLIAKILSVQFFINNGVTNSKDWINAMFFLAFVYYFIELKRFLFLSDLVEEDKILSKELGKMEVFYCMLGLLIELLSFLDREALHNLTLHPIQTINIPIWFLGILGSIVVLRIVLDKNNIYQYCLVGDILLFIVYCSLIQMQYLEDETIGLVGFIISCLIIDRVIKKIYVLISWKNLWGIVLAYIVSVPVMIIISQSFAKFNYMVMVIVAIVYTVFEAGEKGKENTVFCCRLFCIMSFAILLSIATRSSYIQFSYILMMICTVIIIILFVKIKAFDMDIDNKKNWWKEITSRKPVTYIIFILIPLAMAFKISVFEKDYLHIEYATQKIESTKKSNTIGRIYGLDGVHDLQIAWDDQEPQKIKKKHFNVKVKGKVLTVTVKDAQDKEHIYKHYYYFY